MTIWKVSFQVVEARVKVVAITTVSKRGSINVSGKKRRIRSTSNQTPSQRPEVSKNPEICTRKIVAYEGRVWTFTSVGTIHVIYKIFQTTVCYTFKI
jgi:hypothetical protein